MTTVRRKLPNKRVISMFFLAIITSILIGCGGQSSCKDCASDGNGQGNNSAIVAKTIVASFTAQVDVNGEAHFYNSASEPITVDQLRAAVEAMPKDETKGIEIKILPPDGDIKNPVLTDASRLWLPIPWTCYGIVINWHKDYVGSCIKRDVWHLNFNVQNRCEGRMIFDAHLCSWWQNGPQFGLYVTPSGWCRTTRGNYTAVKDTLKDALLAAGLGVTAAVVISNFSTPVIVPLLAL